MVDEGGGVKGFVREEGRGPTSSPRCVCKFWISANLIL